MPRVAGQIDPRKSEAILEAASALFAEHGPSVTMEGIAREAGVSKQTLYNRFASKADIARALAEKRSIYVTAPLGTDADPLTVLTALAAALLERVCTAAKGESLRAVALMTPAAPDIALAIYEGGPGASLRKLSTWLKAQDAKGLLAVPDADLAAEMFTGMVLGHGHLRSLLGVPHPTDSFDVRAAEAARRFIRAFAPE